MFIFQHLRLSLFVAAHLVCVAAIWTGVSVADLVLCFALYGIRMFAVTAGYHRYFAHRTYKMGRVMQTVMAFLAETSAQRGVLWWASHHRHHHSHSDREDDVHSPRQRGFFWSHVGWVLSSEYADTDWDKIKDMAKYPELRWLNKHDTLPPVILAIVCFLIGGWSGLIVGFFWSTVLLWHGTFTINSFSHIIGRQRFATGDDSRNNWFLALITLGEGWHNNHHYCPSSASQGMFWWEVDISYYLLRALSAVGLVSDLKRYPARVYQVARGGGSKAAEGDQDAAGVGVPPPPAAEPAP